MRPAYIVRARHHVEMTIAERCVHIEAIEQELGGPGGTNKEVRVYVDGVLEGRGILLGRLGGTVNTYPVVAAFGADMMIRVRPASGSSLQELRIELLRCENEDARDK
jgi:hypothetical protein